MNNKKLITSLLLILTLAACGGDKAIEKSTSDIAKQAIDKADPAWKTKLSKPALLTFTQGKDYFWELETTQGNMTIKLFTDTAPMHVSSTIYLTELGFYDDVIFHRVIPGFMAQGGDPTGTGRGNPGYTYEGEFEDGKSHDQAGMLSMANAGSGTDGSQFFITFKATPFLDGKHTVFGQVVKGLDTTVAEIEAFAKQNGQGSGGIVITKASIRVADSVEQINSNIITEKESSTEK